MYVTQFYCEHSLIRKTLSYSEGQSYKAIRKCFESLQSTACFIAVGLWWCSKTMVTFLCECQQSRSPKMAEPWLHRMQGIIRYRALKNASEPNTTHRGCDLSAGFGFDSIQFKTEISLNFIVLALSLTRVFSLELWISKYDFKVYKPFQSLLAQITIIPHLWQHFHHNTYFSSNKALFKTKFNINLAKLCKKN